MKRHHIPVIAIYASGIFSAFAVINLFTGDNVSAAAGVILAAALNYVGYSKLDAIIKNPEE